MKRINYLPFKFDQLFSLFLKTLILVIGINILLTTIFILVKDQIRDNYQQKASYLFLKDIRWDLKKLS